MFNWLFLLFSFGNFDYFKCVKMFFLYFTKKSNSITASMPSAIANGICVIAKIAPNLMNESMKPGDGKASASWADVTTYVTKLPSAAARKMPTLLFSFSFLAVIQMRYAGLVLRCPLRKRLRQELLFRRVRVGALEKPVQLMTELK